MSLLLAYTFNDNNTTSFADFSGNKQTGSGAVGSMVSGQNYGYAAYFSATSNHISVTPSNFSGITAITVFSSIYLSTYNPNPGGVYYILNQSNSVSISINQSGSVVFKVWNTALGSYVTLTSAATLSLSTWYTLGCVADGTNMYIYINAVPDSNTASNSGIGINNNAVYIGNDTAVDTMNTFNGYIDNIEVRSVAASVADIVNLDAYPGGLPITNTSNNFATGDLVADNTNTFQGIVTWVVDTANFYMYPLSELNTTYYKIGNVYQSSRQYLTQLLTDFDGNGNGQMLVMFPIAGFADYASPANSYTLDKNGFEGLAALITGSTAVTQSSGDNSTKIATTAYVDATIPGAWVDFSGTIAPTGYAAGSPTITTARVKLVGSLVFGEIDFTGVSNSTALTITLPYAAKAVCCLVGFGKSNTTGSTALMVTAAGSTTATLYYNMSVSLWTATSTKQVTLSFCYEKN